MTIDSVNQYVNNTVYQRTNISSFLVSRENQFAFGFHYLPGLSAPNKSVWIPNASRDIDYNGGANIVCIVQSLVPAHWSMWLKTDESGRTAKNLTDRHTVIAKTFRWLTELVLQIKNATEEDAGTYICRAAVGTDTEEHKARLTVKGTSEGWRRGDISSILGMEGNRSHERIQIRIGDWINVR